MVLSADKGRVSVFLNTDKYHTKMPTLIENGPYQRLNKDRLTRKLSEKLLTLKIISFEVAPKEKQKERKRINIEQNYLHVHIACLCVFHQYWPSFQHKQGNSCHCRTRRLQKKNKKKTMRIEEINFKTTRHFNTMCRWVKHPATDLSSQHTHLYWKSSHEPSCSINNRCGIYFQ